MMHWNKKWLFGLFFTFMVLTVIAMAFLSLKKSSEDKLSSCVKSISAENGGIETAAERFLAELAGDEKENYETIKGLLRKEQSGQARSLLIRALGKIGSSAKDNQLCTDVSRILVDDFKVEKDVATRGQTMLALIGLISKNEIVAFAKTVALDETEDRFIRQDAVRLVSGSGMNEADLQRFYEALANSKDMRISQSALRKLDKLQEKTKSDSPIDQDYGPPKSFPGP